MAAPAESDGPLHVSIAVANHATPPHAEYRVDVVGVVYVGTGLDVHPWTTSVLPVAVSHASGAYAENATSVGAGS